MAIRRDTKGTGITAREIIVADGDDLKSHFMEFAASWNAKQERGQGDYGAISLDMEDELKNVLAKAGPEPFEPDSREDYAKRVLSCHDLAKKLIKAGNADGAARFASQAGYLYCEGVMKFKWEPMVMVVLRQNDNREAQYIEKRDENVRLVERFDEEKRKNPKIFKYQIYNILINEFDGIYISLMAMDKKPGNFDQVREEEKARNRLRVRLGRGREELERRRRT